MDEHFYESQIARLEKENQNLKDALAFQKSLLSDAKLQAEKQHSLNREANHELYEKYYGSFSKYETIGFAFFLLNFVFAFVSKELLQTDLSKYIPFAYCIFTAVIAIACCNASADGKRILGKLR